MQSTASLRIALRRVLLLVSLCAAFLPGLARADTALPTIWAFNMSGSGTINRGESVELNWSVSNNTTEVSISPGVGVVTGTSVVVRPEVTTTYVLTARNGNGFVAKSRKITVIVPPTITSFTANPARITAGQAATLAWTATGANYYYLAADVGHDPGRLTARSATVRPRATTTYTLTAFNSAGSTTQTLTLPVEPAAARPVIASFTADPTTIYAGDSTSLSWQVSGATSLAISPGVGVVTGTSVAVTPTANTTYVLTATNATGSVTRSVPVTVAPRPVPPPFIQAFQVSPVSIIAGEQATLSWSVDGATDLQIQPDIGAVTGNSIVVAPTATRTYQLTATNAGGTVSRTVTLEVLPPEPPPSIGFFLASPSSIAPGASSTLTWSVTGAATVSLIADTGSGPGPVTGSSYTVSPTATTTYTLIAANTAGITVSQSVTVAVVTPAPAIPSFTANPAVIDRGGATTLSWSVQNAETVSIAGIGVVSGNSVTVSPSATTTYTLTASNAAGTVSANVQVAVNVPLPVVQSFAVSPATITSGQTAALTWSVTGADRVAIAPGFGEVTGDTLAVSPAQTTTYELTASNDGGSVTRAVTLTVETPEPAPEISAFTASPATITLGSSSTLAWTVSGAASISIAANTGPSPGVVTGDSITVSPTENTTYTLTATNQSGVVATRSVAVAVTAPLPVIHSFAATPASVSAGTASTLAWSVTGATQLTIAADVGPSPGNVTGVNLAVTPEATTVYTLTARNAEGALATATATVTVTPRLPAVEITSFTASSYSIQPGESVTLAWEAVNAQSFYMSSSPGPDTGDVRGRSSVVVSPTRTTRYTLQAYHSQLGTAYKSVTVVVGPAPVPVITSFRAEPATVRLGRSVTLSWSVENSGDTTITASRGASPGAVTGTSLTAFPTESTTYTITVRNQFGEASASTSVTVTPPVPVVEQFSVAPASIIIGQSATLSWTVAEAEQVAITASAGASPGPVSGNTLVVTPTVTTTYTLRATNAHGETTRQATLTVTPPVPVITLFCANPEAIMEGQSTTLEWSVADAEEVSITADEGASPGVVAATGTQVVTPVEDTIYTLRARNSFGTVSREFPVTVAPLPRPIIDSFRGTPAFIEAGESVTLNWSVRDTDTVTITADVGASPGTVTGNSVTVSPVVSTVYTLTAANEYGQRTASFPITIYVPGDGSVAHPRIWITPQRVTELQARARANDPAWIALRNRCDALATRPVLWPDQSPTGGQAAIWGGYQYIDYLLPATELSLGYAIAKGVDEPRAAAYAAKARDIALKLSDPILHGRESTDSGFSIRAYPPALALIYDWVYAEFHPRERAQIYHEINRWIRWFDSHGVGRGFPNGNYFAGYYCAKALAALATEGDNPEASVMWNDWLNRIHYGMVQPYHQQWLRGGGAPDGWNYGPFETINMLRPLLAARTAKGLDLLNGGQPFAWADGHAQWIAHFTWPDLKSVNDRGFLYNSNNPTPITNAWATEYTGLLRGIGGANAPVAQRFLLDLRARAGNDAAPEWTELLHFDASAPTRGYRDALSYRTPGDGQVAMRSSWNADAVFAAFQAGPYTGSDEQAEQFYDQGALTINRGHVGFVVNAWGAMLRNTPGTEDGGTRRSTPQGNRSAFEELYSELYGGANDTIDGTTQPRRLFNTFYAPHAYRAGLTGFFSQVNVYGDEARTTLAKFEDAQRHVLMRGSHLEDMYWLPEPIRGWERTVVYVRPQVFFVYDRTRVSSGAIDHWMSWSVLRAPLLIAASPAAVVYDVVDTQIPQQGPLYRGRLTALLPVNRQVDPVNLFGRGKVFRMDIRAAAPAPAETSWLTVFDAAGSADSAGTASTLSAAAGNVLAGDVEGAVVETIGGQNAAALFSRTGNAMVAGTIQFRLPAHDTYCVLSDLAPDAGYSVSTEVTGDSVVVTVTAGGDRLTSPEGVLAFDVTASAAELR
jgi:PKD repeat protein